MHLFQDLLTYLSGGIMEPTFFTFSPDHFFHALFYIQYEI